MKGPEPVPGARASRVAVITGAGRGLGRIVARQQAGPGVRLLLVARTREELESTSEECRALGAEVTPLCGDLREESFRRAIARSVTEEGRLDLLFNGASELGPSPRPALREFPLDRLRDLYEVNVLAPLALLQLTVRALSAARGLVVNVSSDAAVGAYPGWGGYGSSKAALDLLSRTLAAELHDTGISVVSVDPGDLRTRMHQDAYPGEDISDRPLPEVTLPFWVWLFGQAPERLTGHRYRAQDTEWVVPA
jgi:NAD(P)-dependent dehydrogenase (short-subunit alcohol dehydrogenase family)